MKKTVSLSVEIGYELQSVELSATEWDNVKAGKELLKTSIGWYEGVEHTYEFHFNSNLEDCKSMVVTYSDSGIGFIGDISDALVWEPNATEL